MEKVIGSFDAYDDADRKYVIQIRMEMFDASDLVSSVCVPGIKKLRVLDSPEMRNIDLAVERIRHCEYRIVATGKTLRSYDERAP
jgi:hypothetical protein